MIYIQMPSGAAPKPNYVTMPSIIKEIVCNFFGISKQQMDIKTKERDVVFPRQVCMALMRKYTTLSLAGIGARFGGYDHSTVMHAIQTVNNLFDTDEEFKKNYLTLQDIIMNKQ